MTSNSLSTNSLQNTANNTAGPKRLKGAFLWHSCRSYWWLAVICSVVYGFAGPIATLLKIDSITQPSPSNYAAAQTEETLLNSHLQQMAQWFSSSGFLFLYCTAIVLAAVIGCVMFFYLQQKRQVFFYHSQPITRTRLFWNQYATGLLLNVIPLLLMVLLTVLATFAHGFGAALTTLGVLQNVLYMLLYLLASYSIAVLAGQLAGTMLTQLALNAVLHFAIPAAVWIVQLMMELFFATHSVSSSLLMVAMRFSPLGALFVYADRFDFSYYDRKATAMTVNQMELGMLLTELAMIAVCTALAWFLYQKRPSEATGKALVYPFSEPILKGYLMFIAGVAGGMIFYAMGSKLFFYFALLAFAVLTHMTCEVIFQQDFKAMLGRMPQCVVLVVLIVAVVCLFRFDVFGYDRYLPEVSQVQQVRLDVNNGDFYSYNNYGSNFMEQAFCDDEAVKQQVHDLLQQVIAQKQYRSSDFDGYRRDETGQRNYISVEVDYVLQNGQQVSRCYRSVPCDAIQEAYAALYNQAAFREAWYQRILQITPQSLESLQVGNTLIYQAYDTSNDMDIQVDGKAHIVTARPIVTTTTATERAAVDTDTSLADELAQSDDKAVAAQLLQAYQQDLRDRQFATIQQPEIYKLDISAYKPDLPGLKWHANAVVYPGDKRTMAILQALQITNIVVDANCDRAVVFRCNQDMTEEELRSILDEKGLEKNTRVSGDVDAYITYLQGTAEVVADIEGHSAVKQFIDQTYLCHNAGAFPAFDSKHFVLLRYNYQDKPDSGELFWELQLVYANTLPEQYQ